MIESKQKVKTIKQKRRERLDRRINRERLGLKLEGEILKGLDISFWRHISE